MPTPETAPVRRDEPEDTLDGRWEIRARLPGAMGSVLLLTDPATGGRFAAKTPRVEHGLSPDLLRRFEAEARMWLSLGHHENVVEAIFYESIRWQGVDRPFLFLEFVDGPTLDALLRVEGRLAVPVVLDVMTGIAWGMSHAHGDGRAGTRIVHRDLKPDNVFLTRDRVAKVSDFGIARALDRPEEHQGEGFGLGTPFYAAPEQMRDATRADVRSDVYSYGAVVHQLLSGHPPFPAEDLSTLVLRVLRDEPPPIRRLVPDVPEPLERLILDCLAKEPTARPASFAEVLERVSAVREIDSLWLPPAGSRSCPACGLLTLSPTPSCGLCGKRTGKASRYAPASRRSDRAAPTLGRSGTDARLEIEGAQLRPRNPRAGDEVVVTVLVGNSGGVPAVDVALPFVRPSRDAFAFVDHASRRGFRGTVPPTAEGAPLRISWTIRPLREGRYRLRAPRVTWRDAAGGRRSVRGQDLEIVVAPNDRAPIVGREAELGALVGLLDGADAGKAALGIVLGMPGTGKSRLIREVLDRAADRGFASVRGRCLDRGVEVRGALKEILRQILDLPKAGAGAPQIAASLVQLLGDAARTEPRLLAFLVDELVGRPLPPGENAAHLWARFAAVVTRTKALALAVEDVQRDLEVGRIVASMAEASAASGGRFLGLLTARGEAGDQDAEDLLRRSEEFAAAGGATRHVVLRPLDLRQVQELVDLTLSPNDFGTSAPWLAEELRSVTGGNPLFLAELLRLVRSHAATDASLVTTRAGAWTAGAHLTPESLRGLVPPRVEQMVTARLRELPPDVRRFAYAAAVLGDVFETDLLRALLDEPPTFEASLATLEEEGLLREIAGGRIRFREPLLPEVLHRDLRASDPVEHARLHAAAADRLSARPGARDRNSLRLARHELEAGRPQRAFPALVDAARRLVQRQAYRRAAGVLAEAEKLLEARVRPRRSERVEYLTLRGTALRYTGDLAGALDAWQSVVAETAGGRGDSATIGEAYDQLGKVHESLGQLDDALYCLAVGLSLRRESGQSHDVPLSLAHLAGLHLLRGEPDRAAGYLEEALATAAATENHLALGRALVLRARLLVQRGETRDARVCLRRGLQEARIARDDMGAGDAWVTVGHACYREGRVERALVHFRRALRIRQHAGDLPGIGASLGTLGSVHEAMGDLDAAQSEFARAADLHRSIGSRRSLVVALANLGRVQNALALPKKARATLEEAVAEARPMGNTAFLAAASAELALASRRLGDVAPCAELFAEARRVAAASGDPDIEAYVAVRFAEHEDAAGRRAAALAAIESAAALPRLSPQVRVLVVALRADLSTGDAASAAAEEAAALASRLPSPVLRARALAAAGRADLEAGDEDGASTRLRQATGLLLSSGQTTPLLAAALADSARAQARRDPAAAAAARRRAAEVLRELRARGFSDAPGTGFPAPAPRRAG